MHAAISGNYSTIPNISSKKELVEEAQGKMEEVKTERIHDHRRQTQEDQVLCAAARGQVCAIPLAGGRAPGGEQVQVYQKPRLQDFFYLWTVMDHDQDRGKVIKLFLVPGHSS